MINKDSYYNKREKELMAYLKHNVARFYELCGINMLDIDKNLRYRTRGLYIKEKLKFILFKIFYRNKVKIKNKIRDITRNKYCKYTFNENEIDWWKTYIRRNYVLKNEYSTSLSRLNKMRTKL